MEVVYKDFPVLNAIHSIAYITKGVGGGVGKNILDKVTLSRRLGSYGTMWGKGYNELESELTR